MGIRGVEVLNPVSIEASVLRTSLIPGALAVAQHNAAHGQGDLRLFEIGNVFELKSEVPTNNHADYGEEERLLILLSGKIAPEQYGTEHRQVDIFDLKGEVGSLLAKFCLDKYRFISYSTASALIESALAVEINGTYAGLLGKISKSIAERFDIGDAVFVCELNVSVIHRNWDTEKKLKAIPRFPGVRRDLAFVLDSDVSHEVVEQTIREAGGNLLANVVLFDLFQGGQLGVGKKSLAYSLEFQPLDRTLVDREVDAEIQRIVNRVEQTCKARLRAS